LETNSIPLTARTFILSRHKLHPGLIALLVLTVAIVGCRNSTPEPTPQVVVAGVVLEDGTVATPTPLPEILPPDEVPAGLEVVWEAYGIMVREYVNREKVDPAVLAEAAIEGMVDALEDRYTAYITPETFGLESNRLEGDFEGIGAQVERTRDATRVMITAPLPDTPAERAGIRAGDIIMAVDGEDTLGWSVLDAVNRIRGKRGTTVVLSVVHLGELDPVDVPIIRGKIPQNSVYSRLLEDAPYGVARIATFTQRTPDELRDSISELRDQGAEGIILDLRNNPGGLLSTTVETASEFLDGGLVTYEVDGRGNRRDWGVKSGGKTKNFPLVVLVNSGSASGSEVLTAALQDHQRAVVIGTTTFGKGSVNTLRTLRNGGGLYITFAHWFSPNGRLIEGDGVVPDVTVEYDPTLQSARHGAEDTQLAAAIKQLDFETGNTSASTAP
jgi:carboxyl-terminal processing protease